jgi:MFS family permease
VSEFVTNLRRMPRTFWVLIGATFVNRFGLFVWPFLTLFITSKGNSPREAGYAVSIYSLGSLVAALAGGWLADRLGRNITMALSSFGSAVCMMIMSQCEDWRALCVIAFFTGLISEVGYPASQALIQDIVPEGQRVMAFAAQRFAINLGWSLGPATAGFLAKYSFFWLFAVDAATSVFFGMVCWLWLPRGERTESHLAKWSVALASIRNNKAFIAMCIAALLNSWVWRVTSTTMPLHFKNSSLPIDWLGYVLAINGIMIITMEMPFAAFTLRHPVRRMLSIGYVLMATCFLLLMGHPGVAAFVFCIVVFTIGEMFAFSRQQAYVANLAPDDMRGRYAGFMGLSWSIGGIISSVGGLMLYEWQPNAVWIVTAVLGCSAAVIVATK